MVKGTLILLLVLYFLVVPSNGGKINGRILGGNPTDISTVPYLVSVQRCYIMGFYCIHTCGGAIISNRHILTAAHCLQGWSGPIKVIAGSNHHLSGGASIKVCSTVTHKRFDVNSITNDIAVLHMCQDLIYGSTVQRVNLPSKGWEPPIGALATVSGWGALKESGEITDDLHSAQIAVVEHRKCEEYYKAVGNITVGMFCTGSPKGQVDSCQGDSGGPLVINNTLIGIISWGVGCGRIDYPGINTKVSAYVDWIQDNTGIIAK